MCVSQRRRRRRAARRHNVADERWIYYVYIYIHVQILAPCSLISKLSKPHSPRTHTVAPHELRCDSPAHSANKAAFSLHSVYIYIYMYIYICVCVCKSG